MYNSHGNTRDPKQGNKKQTKATFEAFQDQISRILLGNLIKTACKWKTHTRAKKTWRPKEQNKYLHKLVHVSMTIEKQAKTLSLE